MLLCYFNNIKNLTAIFMSLKRRQQNCRGVVYATLTSPNQALMELQLQLSQKWNLQSVSKESADEHSLGHLSSRPLPPSKGKWPGKNLAPVPFCLSFCTAPQSSLNVDWFMNGWIKSIRPLKCTLLNLVFHSVMLTTVNQDQCLRCSTCSINIGGVRKPCLQGVDYCLHQQKPTEPLLVHFGWEKTQRPEKKLNTIQTLFSKVDIHSYWVYNLLSNHVKVMDRRQVGKSDGWPAYLLSLVFALEFQVSESWVQGPVERKFMDKVCGCYQLGHPTGSCSCCCLVAQSCLTLCDPMDCSTPGFFSLHHLPKLAQTHVHWVSDAIQPSHPLSSPSPAFNLSQHQGLFHESTPHIRWPKYWNFSFSISPSNEYSEFISFWIDWFDLLIVQWTLKSLLQHHSSCASPLINPSQSICLWIQAFHQGNPHHTL